MRYRAGGTACVQKPPQTWNDLLDAQWKDQVTVGHPGFSGFVAADQGPASGPNHLV
ncbi:MAG TPA: hypothetical protein VF937_08240 [Chloroflexota bacterium]